MEIKRDLTARFIGKGFSPRKVVGIILHDTAGSGTHNDTRYLANPGDGRKVSVDFTVERDGSVYQLNPELKTNWCFHAGRATQFKGLRNQSVTKACIGIEIVQRADLGLTPLYPKAQIDAVAALCSHLCDEFELTRADITTHAKVITDGSRSDPRKFPFDAFWTIFDTLSGTAGDYVFHVVEDGDTLWSLAKKYNTHIETIKGFNGMNAASNTITLSQKLRVR